MGLVKGIRAINEKLNESSGSSGNGTKVRWLQIKDGQSVKIRFVNEIGADSPNYDPERGEVAIVAEHTSPKDYTKKAACSMEDEGRCFGCEMHRNDPKAGWRDKKRFYTNVLVDNGTDDPYVAIWSMGTFKSPTFTTIQDYVDDVEVDSLSNMTWKLKRSGEKTETTYSLLPGQIDKTPFDWADYKAFPLESAIRTLPYAEQEAFYIGFSAPGSSADATW
jgi:hypothetical protein